MMKSLVSAVVRSYVPLRCASPVNLRHVTCPRMPYFATADYCTAEQKASAECADEKQEAATEDPKQLALRLDELTKLNAGLTEKAAEFEDKYKRALAETENVRRRMLKQVEEAKVFGIQTFCKDMLEIADILQIAVSAIPEETLNSNQEVKNLHDGMVMTNTQLLKIFAKHGLVQENPLGKKFDPNIHEAVFEVPDPSKKPGTVAVVQKVGYLLHSRTLRAAQVGVVKARS